MTEIEKLKKQLEIAIAVLSHYENRALCQKALAKIAKLEEEYESSRTDLSDV
jgi:hypothetical protein